MRPVVVVMGISVGRRERLAGEPSLLAERVDRRSLVRLCLTEEPVLVGMLELWRQAMHW